MLADPDTVATHFLLRVAEASAVKADDGRSWVPVEEVLAALRPLLRHYKIAATTAGLASPPPRTDS